MSTSPTMQRLLDLAGLPAEAISRGARVMADFSLFDWMVVARAGADEPVGRIVRELVLEEGGRPMATVVGTPTRLPARAAALANGTISHALDYDDTHFAHIGHLSVAILPAALAVAESIDASATAVRDAFVIGAEVACRLGMVLGRDHYERGFHQTATAGAFGATVAAGRLLGLSEGAMRNALSLVATRASGLKSQFGTMGKPFNAGIAAANGIEAAWLASRGFVSCADSVGGVQGFLETHGPPAVTEAAAWESPPPSRLVFEDNKYKLHACCHGLHATINALRSILYDRPFPSDAVQRVLVRTNPRWLRVCDIKRPCSGLELKFSYALVVAMVLLGIDTAADRTYTDALSEDPLLADVGTRVVVEGDSELTDTQACVVINLVGGDEVVAFHDLAVPLLASDLETGLRGKSRALLGHRDAEALWSSLARLDTMSARNLAACIHPAFGVEYAPP